MLNADGVGAVRLFLAPSGVYVALGVGLGTLTRLRPEADVGVGLRTWGPPHFATWANRGVRGCCFSVPSTISPDGELKLAAAR